MTTANTATGAPAPTPAAAGAPAPAATPTPAAAGAPAPVATPTATPGATNDELVTQMSQLMRQLQMMARERDERRREDATPPPAQNREGMSTGVKLALAGFGLLVALFVLVAVLGVGWYAYQSFSNPVATAAASESSTTQVVLAEVAPLAVAEPVAAPVENGAHPGREFVKTENGFGLLCFVGSKKICWFNASDEIAPTTPAGTKVLKVNASELNRHGIGPTTPKARAEWAELTPASWTYVVVPAATAASWRTASK